jgi:ABC-type multidrug transport system ATPase subunit
VRALTPRACPQPSVPTCKQNVRDLIVARDYENAIAKSTFGIAACQKSSATSAYTPTQALLDQLNAITATQLACQADQRSQIVLPHISSVTPGSIAAVTSQGAGVMGKYSLNNIYEPEFSSFATQLFQSVVKTGLAVNATLLAQAQFQLYSALGLDPADMQYVPWLTDICGVPYLEGLLTTILNNDTAATASLCAMALNLDGVRGLSTTTFPTSAGVDKDVYSSWFGQVYQSALMHTDAPTLPATQQYRQRQFYTKFGAAAFGATDPDNAQYQVMLYHNRTAVSNLKTANWKELSSLMDSAIVRTHLPARDTAVRFKDMPLAFKCNRDAWLNGTVPDLNCDLLQGSLLFPYIFLIQAFLIVTSIVYEKEQRLRVIMRMNGGLRNSVYWGVTYVFYFVQFIIMSLLIFLMGRGANLHFVSLHEPAVYWIFIFLWGNLLIVFSFLLSIFFASSKTATASVLLIVLILNIVGSELITVLINDPNSTNASYSSLMWLPPFVMIRVVVWMALTGAFGQKLTVANLSTFADGAIAQCFGFMIIEWFACVFLVWYLDQVWVAGFGVRQPPLFFLDRHYWAGTKHDVDEAHLAQIETPPGVVLTTENNVDVKAETERVINGGAEANMVVRIVKLHKAFDSYVAVKSLCLGINRNECFGLLGHNGAGKTTAINMLVGLFEPTAGTALVDGLSIRTDMDSVQTRMGVCPQHDVTWGPLSCREHVLFYARLKGVPAKLLTASVDRALMDVNLKRFEHRRADALSGGMRRRLSVAMALIGTPAVVYLDEPSTGLDPASKRSLWNVVAKAKGNKSIVLTTHSMEEAEVLCDRVGIMALGELQCIGTAAELKLRFGAGYTFLVACSVHESNVVNQFVTELFPRASPLGKQFGGTFKYEIPRSDVTLSRVFELMEAPDTRAKLKLVDWALTETTLEEVFLKLAEQAHVDEAISKAPAEEKSWWQKCTLKRKGAA